MDRLASVVHHLLRNGATSDLNGLADGSVGQTVLDEVGHLGGRSGQAPGVEEVSRDNAGTAFLRLDGGLRDVAGGEAIHVQLVELVLQGGEVEQSGDLVAVDLDQTVVVGLLGPLVDQTAGERLGHLLTVQGLHFGESTGEDRVATVLREKDGGGGISELVGQDVVATGLVGSGTAPRVGIQAEKVDARAGGVGHLTLEVGGGIDQDVSDIGSGVANGDGAGGVLGNVVLHVTDDGTLVGWSQPGSSLVDNLVTGKETEEVVKVLEGLNHAEHLGKVDGVVGSPGRRTVEGTIGQRRVDI